MEMAHEVVCENCQIRGEEQWEAVVCVVSKEVKNVRTVDPKTALPTLKEGHLLLLMLFLAHECEKMSYSERETNGRVLEKLSLV
jgi:hypothetical protein